MYSVRVLRVAEEEEGVLVDWERVAEEEAGVLGQSVERYLEQISFDTVLYYCTRSLLKLY